MIVTENEDKNQVKEPVKIRFKELINGSKSIYLDIYVNGVREYEFLNIYLKPEKTRANKSIDASLKPRSVNLIPSL